LFSIHLRFFKLDIWFRRDLGVFLLKEAKLQFLHY
jgi:hypothetical protein